MKLLEFPIRRYQFTMVAFLCLVALGWYAFTSVPREEDPYFKIPGFTIAAIYPGADPEGSRAPGGQAPGRPVRGARRRAQDGDLDPRRRVVHRHRVPGFHRRGQEIRRDHARAECAASGIPAGNAVHRAQVLARPGEHHPGGAGVRGCAVSRTRRLRARSQGPAQDRGWRAQLGKLGFPGARAARGAGPETHGRTEPRAGAGHRRRAERERQHSGRFHRPGSTQFFAEDFRQLHLARPGERHRDRLGGRSHRAHTRRRRCQLEQRGLQLHGALQRQTRGVRHRQPERRVQHPGRARTRDRGHERIRQ